MAAPSLSISAAAPGERLAESSACCDSRRMLGSRMMSEERAPPTYPRLGPSGDRQMSQSAFDAAFSEIQSIYAKWLAGSSASEQALFEIGDVLQTFADGSPPPAPSIP